MMDTVAGNSPQDLMNAIAIDGPVAAGKGTVAKLLSEKLGGFHLYSGAMYRCLALYCLEHTISVTDESAVINALGKVQFDLHGDKVTLNGEDVTEKIKQRSVATAASNVAVMSAVRQEMVKRQQEIGTRKIKEGQVAIAEGRDAATKIFPNAKLKIFLTASPEVRAKRRFQQMGGENNNSITFKQILADTIDRDERDMKRTVDPLVSDPEKHGYFVLDDSQLTEEQTISAILSQWQKVTQ